MFLNGFKANPMQRLMMGKIVFIGLCHLQIVLGTNEQFISVLWNEFFLLTIFCKSLWTSAGVQQH